MARMYSQKVSATMHRISSDTIGPIFIRKNTKVSLGLGNHAQGAVIMSNPGSYAPKYSDRDWKAYCKGEGSSELQGWGYPDLTMQNVLQVTLDAAKAAGYLLNGGMDIYNLSAVVQPKGQDAERYHQLAQEALLKSGRHELLTESWMDDNDSFKRYFSEQDYQFVIVGFAEKLFKDKQRNIQAWASSIPNVFYAEDDIGRWSHPRRWRTDPELGEKIQVKLSEHFRKLARGNL